MFSGASNYAESVDNVMFFITSISVVMLIGMTFFMILFVIKYNRKRHPVASQIEGNTFLEILWIVLPTILVMIMFYYGYANFIKLRENTPSQFTVNVTAFQWGWKFNYANGVTTDTLYIPLEKTTKLEMKSNDVIHSLYIPAMRIKEDVLASQVNYIVLTPKFADSYDIACAEYCGLRHAYMYTKLVVMPQAEFDKWLSLKTAQLVKDAKLKENTEK